LKTKLQTKALTYQSLTENKNYKHESRKVINPNMKLQCLSGNKGENGEFSTPKELKRFRPYQP
jgi:phage protein U